MFFPEFVAWVASLCVVAIFLAAYAIPVTFHSVMTVVGSNSISNTVAVTPGGAGVNQAFNVAALSDVTDSQTATAYSVAQQLVSTAWSILFALVLMIWVFGWGGGKTLVQQSYEEAKKKAEEQKAKKAAEHGGTRTSPAALAPDQVTGCGPAPAAPRRPPAPAPALRRSRARRARPPTGAAPPRSSRSSRTAPRRRSSRSAPRAG